MKEIASFAKKIKKQQLNKSTHLITVIDAVGFLSLLDTFNRQVYIYMNIALSPAFPLIVAY